MENNLKKESVSEKKARKRQQVAEQTATEQKAGFWAGVKQSLRADWQKWALMLLSLLFAAFLFIDFGNFSMPDSYFKFAQKYEAGSGQSVNNEVIVKLNYMKGEDGKIVGLDEVWMHAGGVQLEKGAVAELTFAYSGSSTGTWYSSKTPVIKMHDNAHASGDDAKNYRMYKWTRLYNNVDFGSNNYEYIKISTKSPVYVNELVFLDKNMNAIPVEVVSGDEGAANLFDESDKFIELAKDRVIYSAEKAGFYDIDANRVNHRMNSIIFDEYYFARSAFDYLNGEAPYLEVSHPPLGKILLAVGIGVFGMNTFGMRIMPALFTLATLFIVYALGKRLIKNSKTAGLIFAALFAFAGMNISMGRIGTTDAFLTFFLVLSFYYMLVFLQNGINRKYRFLSFVPLVLSGVFFGMAASVKWSGITAGAGLFAMFALFFAKLVLGGVKKVKALASGAETVANGEEILPYEVAAKQEKNELMKDSVLSVVFAGVGFIVLGFAMYLLSYLIVGSSYCVYSNTTNVLKAFWENQKYIMNFHTGNMAGDDNTSGWWGWPINFQAACFAVDDGFSGKYERVLCMGNMLAFAFSLIALIYIIVEMCIVKFSKSATDEDKAFVDFVKKPFWFLVIAFAACYVPSMFIKRPMYPYTFLTASVFYVGFLALFLSAVLETKKNVISRGFLKGKTVGGVMVVTTLSLVVVCFLMFYPGFAGLPLPYKLARVLFGWACLNHGVYLP
ncbi:MAG: phospholipid carrier-dependent glycosyltransferase [Clostridiales bacterium]|nr:phospholipid carrier-dependent glycosyltransferase [Clostridiales bacterium]